MTLAPPAPSIDMDHRARYLTLSSEFEELRSLTRAYTSEAEARFERINAKLEAFRSAHITGVLDHTMEA